MWATTVPDVVCYLVRVTELERVAGLEKQPAATVECTSNPIQWENCRLGNPSSGSGLGQQHDQCIMGVEVFFPIWQKGRQQPCFSLFSLVRYCSTD